MNISSGTVVLASAVLSFTAAAFGQSQHNSSSQPGMNFYVTTPQTGESVAAGIGGPPQVVAAAPGATGSYNTYSSHVPSTGRASRTKQSQAPVHGPAYSVQQVSNAPAAAYQASSTRQAAKSSTRSSRAASSFSSPNFYHASAAMHGQQQANPAYVSNAGAAAQKQGVFSRLLNRKDSRRATANTSTRQAAPALKPSRYNGKKESGIASWYGGKWHGRKTASGERYDMNTLTAAHKSLPFGTLVKVRNERNGREVVVRINNRGPFKRGRIIDLSKSAASKLGMVGSGLAKVTTEVVGRS